MDFDTSNTLTVTQVAKQLRCSTSAVRKLDDLLRPVRDARDHRRYSESRVKTAQQELLAAARRREAEFSNRGFLPGWRVARELNITAGELDQYRRAGRIRGVAAGYGRYCYRPATVERLNGQLDADRTPEDEP